MPAIPTTAKIVRVIMDIVPKIIEIKSRLKNPISPQLIAPMIIKIKETTSNELRSNISTSYITPIIYEFFVKYTLKMNLGFKYFTKAYIIL